MKNSRVLLALSHIVLILISIFALIPFWLLIMASFTSEKSAINDGFKLFPKEFSLDAYRYLLAKWSLFGKGYLITIGVTVVGVVLCVLLTMAFGYMLSRPGLPLKRFWDFYVLFTMLFNGGLVATYTMYSQTFHIKNTFFAYIVPNLLTSAFLIVMVKNYYRSNLPEELIEAARIDGSGEFYIFFKMALPLSKPMIATLGLMSAVSYWNDWTNGMYYIDNQKMYGIQNILNAISSNTKYLMTGGGSAAALPAETARMGAAVFAILPILITYPFFQDYFVKGITMGAVKG